MTSEIERYLLEMEVKGYSKDFRRSSKRALGSLLLYLREGFFIERWSEVEEKHLNSFLVHLDETTKQKQASLRQSASRIRVFFKWLYTKNKPGYCMKEWNFREIRQRSLDKIVK